MKKLQLEPLLKEATLIVQKETATIYQLANGQILKIFNPFYLFLLKQGGINLERKILIAQTSKISPNIIKPTSIVYNQQEIFSGYISNKANGISINDRNQRISLAERSNLHKYAIIYSKLEHIIKKSTDIVIPDLCTADNIFIDGNDNIQLIDYDGMQVKNIRTLTASTTLGDLNQYLTTQKYLQNNLFTKNLDKKSLILLYFLDALGVDLNMVGKTNPYTGRKITLDEIFYLINLHDYDFMQKVENLFHNSKNNEYISEDIFRLAENYTLEVQKHPNKKDYYIKKLIKK